MRYGSLPQPIGTNRTRRIVAWLRSPIYRVPEKVALQGIAYLDDLQAKVDAVKKLQSETAAELDVLMPPSSPAPSAENSDPEPWVLLNFA